MKRFIVLICLLFACHLLFAEITTLYEKREGNYIIDLFKSENSEVFVNPNFITLETMEPTENKNTFIQPYGEQTIEQHDQLVINKSDRSE